MNEIFIPSSQNIIEIFGGEKCYQVPPYQRPYRWDSEQVEELWDDIWNAFEEGDSEYFLGSIILTRNENSKYLDIIDGQQRLTTLTILFCVLRDLYYKNHSDDAKKKRILGRIKNIESGVERLKFRTQVQNQNAFEQEIIKKVNFDKKESQRKIDKFFNTACIFKEKTEKESPESIEKFTDYLLDRVRLITIECTKRSFAFKLFKVLNDRGLDLTASDLIKNDLMSKLASEEDLLVFEQEWIEIEKKAKEMDEDLTELFNYYLYYLLAKNPKKALSDELQTKFKKRESKEIIFEFKKLIKHIDHILNEDSKEIYSLKYLKHKVYWKTILLTAKLENWDKQNFIELVKVLRKFYYLYWLADYTTPKIKQASFNIIGWIKDKKDINYIEKELNKKIKEDRVIVRALRNLKEDAYDLPWCKPLLILIEYQQTDDSNINFIELEKALHVEHILPQAYSKISYWSERFSHEIAENLVNTIGNLTLLSGKKNINASNNPFPNKIDVYSGIGRDGVTGFRITQQVFDQNKDKLEWTKKEIFERQQWILNEISRLFEIDVNQEIPEEDEEKIMISEDLEKINQELKEKVMQLGKDIRFESKKFYDAFKLGRSNFLTLAIRNNVIKIWLNASNLEDPKKLLRDVSEIGHHGTGRYEFSLISKSDLDYILGIIKQTYIQNKEILEKYDISEHLKKIDDPKLVNYVDNLRNSILEVEEDVQEHTNKFRIVFSARKNFCLIGCRKDFLRVGLRINVNPEDYSELEFYKDDEEDWDYVKVTSKTPLEVLMRLIKKTYENQKK